MGGALSTALLQIRQYKARFFVTDTASPELFGLPLIQAFNLFGTRDLRDTSAVTDSSCKSDAKPPINKETLLAEFPECFNGIGEIEGTCHITLHPEVEPVINSPCQVPIALKDEIKVELASMEHQGVIEKVQEGQPTDLVLNVFVKLCHHWQPEKTGKFH